MGEEVVYSWVRLNCLEYTRAEIDVKRLEGEAKLTGAERYIDDIPLPGHLWGMTVRSPAPRGRIRLVRFDPTIDWSEFVIVDHRDIPGPNEVALIEMDMPILAAESTRHVHEPVVLLAHECRETLRHAIRHVEVVVDREPPALDFTAFPAPDQVQHGTDNVLKSIRICKGDARRVLDATTRVISGTYHTGAQEHVYLENHGMTAWLDGGTIVVHGSMQCPYYVHAALVHALGRDAEHVRVIHAPTGGGFGGKEDYPSILALHAALLAMKSNRPIKMIYDRTEDMAATTKRHPARVRHHTAVDDGGRILAQHIDVTLDGGAYVTLSPVVLSRAMIHAAGPYACDNVLIEGRVILTNSVPFGAFRGFGAPQTHFANERHMSAIASEIGMDPVEFRKINLLRKGQQTATGQIIDDGSDRIAVLDTAIQEAAYTERHTAALALNHTHPYLRRGVGIAVFHHGAGFTGAGEVHLASELEIVGRADGRVEIRSANTEMGQGTLTVFTQLAVERLGLAPADIVIATPDTKFVPNSGPTVASRTVMVVGRLVERACDELRSKLGVADDADAATIKQAIVDWNAAHDEELRCCVQYQPPPNIHWDEENYQGDAYSAYAWATYVAEIEVDLRTYTARVVDFVAVQEIGKVINQTLAEGQIQGGVAQAIGWALLEECRWQDGAMANNSLTNYIIPTCSDLPPIRVFFMEPSAERGANGPKGIGELPMDGPAPAIANAIAMALDSNPTTIPLTPESIMELLADEHAA